MERIVTFHYCDAVAIDAPSSPIHGSYVYEGFSGVPGPMRRIHPPIEEKHPISSEFLQEPR